MGIDGVGGKSNGQITKKITKSNLSGFTSLPPLLGRFSPDLPRLDGPGAAVQLHIRYAKRSSPPTSAITTPSIVKLI